MFNGSHKTLERKVLKFKRPFVVSTFIFDIKMTLVALLLFFSTSMKTKDGTFHLYIFFPAMGEIKIALDSVRNSPPHLNFCSDLSSWNKREGKEWEISMQRWNHPQSAKHNRERKIIVMTERQIERK